MKLSNITIDRDRFDSIYIVECDIESGFWLWKTIEHKKFYGSGNI